MTVNSSTGPCGDRHLECFKSRNGLLIPGESLFAQEGHERCREGVVVTHELVVVPGEAEKSVNGARGAGLRLVAHHLDFGRTHGHAVGGDDVAEVLDGVDAESALGELDEHEDRMHVPKVVRPCGAIDEDVIKKYEDEPT